MLLNLQVICEGCLLYALIDQGLTGGQDKDLILATEKIKSQRYTFRLAGGENMCGMNQAIAIPAFHIPPQQRNNGRSAQRRYKVYM
jgi:hypothetical protein